MAFGWAELRTATLNRLTAKLGAGCHADGGGLYLRVTGTGTGARNWAFHLTYKSKKREMGLGSTQSLTLAAARQRAVWSARQPLAAQAVADRRGGQRST